MKTLVIYAHPQTGGHCKTILDEVKANLKQYDLIDLYKQKFDPVLHEDELYTSQAKKVSSAAKAIQQKMSATDKLVFIYPIWWESMPAILHGFLDKVLTPGFAYKYVNGLPKKLLTGKKAIVFYTTGAPVAITKLTGDLPKKMINAALGFCGIKTKVYQFGSCNHLNDKKKAEIKAVVVKALR